MNASSCYLPVIFIQIHFFMFFQFAICYVLVVLLNAQIYKPKFNQEDENEFKNLRLKRRMHAHRVFYTNCRTS